MTLFSLHHKVYAVDIIPEKVELISQRRSPIQDEHIEKYLANKALYLTATLDAKNDLQRSGLCDYCRSDQYLPKFSVA